MIHDQSITSTRWVKRYFGICWHSNDSITFGSTPSAQVLLLRIFGKVVRGIKTGWAVKIAEYDEVCDLDIDIVFSLNLKLSSLSLGFLEIFSPPVKGGADEIILL